MNFATHLACPEKIAAGLAAKILSREGGTVRDAHGQIVTLLREVSLSPSRPCDLPSGPIEKMLNFIGSALPILNLGATVGFGIAALRKLGRIDEKLDLNYAATLDVLKGTNTILTMMERKVRTDLLHAADMAFNARMLEPDSAHRKPLLDHAFVLASGQALLPN